MKKTITLKFIRGTYAGQTHTLEVAGYGPFGKDDIYVVTPNGQIGSSLMFIRRGIAELVK